ncbi:hypothetical protein JXM83_04690 [Candidatus Woesearchaeota archaeon]|nr:hypothetical protein [Candidatus Woesearchaeota archaeon]
MKKIWTDNKIPRIFGLIIVALLVYLFLIYNPNNIFEKFLKYIVLVVFLGLFVLFIRQSTVLITSNGIIIKEFFFLNKSFFYWSDIDKISIRGKEYNGGFVSFVIHTLIIQTKDQKNEYVVKDQKGFIETIKKLKKDKLLSKDLN